eukprot:g4896.t1
MAGVNAESLLSALQEIRAEMRERDERHARELLQLRQKVDRMQGFIHSMHLAGMVQSHEGNLYFKASVGSDVIVQHHHKQEQASAQDQVQAQQGDGQPTSLPAAKPEDPERAARQRAWLQQQRQEAKTAADTKAAQSLPRVPEPWAMRAPKARSFIGQSYAESQKQQNDTMAQAQAERERAAAEQRAQREQLEAAQRAREEEDAQRQEKALAEQEAVVRAREEEERKKQAERDAKKNALLSGMLGSAAEESSSGLFGADNEGKEGTGEAGVAAGPGGGGQPSPAVDSSMFSLDDPPEKSF